MWRVWMSGDKADLYWTHNGKLLKLNSLGESCPSGPLPAVHVPLSASCFAAQWASHSLEPPASWDLHDVVGITFTALHSSLWGLLCRKSDPCTYYQVSVAVWNLGASLSVLHLSCLQSPGHIHDTAFVLLPGPGSCHFTAHSRWLLPTLGAPSWLTLGGSFSVASGSQDKFT